MAAMQKKPNRFVLWVVGAVVAALVLTDMLPMFAQAREAGVYVHESPELVSLLMQVDLDQHIPPELYIAVAELLAWLYRLEHGQTESLPLQQPQ